MAFQSHLQLPLQSTKQSDEQFMRMRELETIDLGHVQE